MDKIYCVNCGVVNDIKDECCKSCKSKLSQKDSIWKDYFYNHIKSDLKGNVTDAISSIVTNYVKSHLYGVIMSALIIATATGWVVNVTSNSYLKKVTTKPEIITYVGESQEEGSVPEIIPDDINLVGVFEIERNFVPEFLVLNEDGTGVYGNSSESHWMYSSFEYTVDKEKKTIKFEGNVTLMNEEPIEYEITGENSFILHHYIDMNLHRISKEDLRLEQEGEYYLIRLSVPIEFTNMKSGWKLRENLFYGKPRHPLYLRSKNKDIILDNLNTLKVYVDLSTYDYEFDEQRDLTQGLDYKVSLPEGVIDDVWTEHILVNLDKE